MNSRDITKKVRTQAAQDAKEGRFRRWATRLGVGGAIFLVIAFCNIYLVVHSDATRAVFVSIKWWFMGGYCVSGGFSIGAITTKAFRDIALAKLGVFTPKEGK